jgi:exopolysaccharide biosynthesis polyprenyl glycosylphosphotransferase
VDAASAASLGTKIGSLEPGAQLQPRVRREPFGSRFATVLRREAVVRRGLAVADAVAVLAALFVVSSFGAGHLLWPVLLAAPVLIALSKSIGIYDRDEHVLHKTTIDEAPRLFGLATLSVLVIWLFEGVLFTDPLSKPQVVELWAFLGLFLVAFRSAARGLTAAAQPDERCLVIGDHADAELLKRQIALAPSVRAEVLGSIPSAGATGRIELPHDIGETIITLGIDRVVISRPRGALEGAEDLLRALRRLKTYGVKISLLPRESRIAGPAVELDHLPGVTLLGIRGLGISRSSRMLKRSFDIAGAGLGTLMISPILLAVAIAIKLDTRGPIFFRQRRIGMDGQAFFMLKFRSMVADADSQKESLKHLNESGDGLFKITTDPRITRVGRIIRRLSLDELPQLWNVLRGEMSLVGPRPLIEEEDTNIEGHFRRRLEVPPGMTGHWQIVCAERRVTLEEMARLDYLYLSNWTLWNDIRLLLRTVPFVIGGRGI